MSMSPTAGFVTCVKVFLEYNVNSRYFMAEEVFDCILTRDLRHYLLAKLVNDALKIASNVHYKLLHSAILVVH